METMSQRIVQGTAILCRQSHATVESARAAKPLGAPRLLVGYSHLGFAVCKMSLLRYCFHVML